MASLRRAPRAASKATPQPPARGEVIAQVLTGVVIGVGLVYAAVVVRKGPVVALVMLLIGLAYLLRNWHRVKWVARGIVASGTTALTAVLVVLLLGHDII